MLGFGPRFACRCAQFLEYVQDQPQLVAVLVCRPGPKQRLAWWPASALTEQGTCRPNVDRRPVGLVGKESLGCAVGACADVETLLVRRLVWQGQLGVPCGAKVGQEHRPVQPLQENGRRLDVAMDDAEAVDVFEGREEVGKVVQNTVAGQMVDAHNLGFALNTMRLQVAVVPPDFESI
ncbi:hypothetical protein SPBR_01006 [Sporothrix brasiliensis 5110]|uniref:Uncharacterized protein n=1 Tax=Sporothrix brasiliensis 5110 TaxID=1398154 RepID=A0A0C2IST0_9PEZI|nr:uncharacterized protein SPBR_01006 [Sporothrix brasiliensis 5110]KIH89910.1 hypothetical protein SPBR_01006 [Sporothrix brasiliensis 5110]